MRVAFSLLAAALLAAPACDGGVLETPPSGPPDPARFGPATGEGFPCDVRQVLVAVCADCHAGQTYSPAFLTPEIVRTGRSLAGRTYGEEMLVRMQDTVKPMPPYGATLRPTEADVAVIAAWVDAGMPTGDCGPLQVPTPLH
jgi:hypothetical protein